MFSYILIVLLCNGITCTPYRGDYPQVFDTEDQCKVFAIEAKQDVQGNVHFKCEQYDIGI